MGSSTRFVGIILRLEQHAKMSDLNDDEENSITPCPVRPGENRVVALLIGFLPSMIWLVVRLLDPSATTKIGGFYLVLALGSLVCCFWAARSFFRRGTLLTIIAGIFFL